MDRQVPGDYLWARWDISCCPVPAQPPITEISDTVFIGVKWPYLKLTFHLGLAPKLRLHVILSHIPFYSLVDPTFLTHQYKLLHFNACKNHVTQIQKYLDVVFLVAAQKLKSHLQSMGRNTQVCGPSECTNWNFHIHNVHLVIIKVFLSTNWCTIELS
jgi:hypothetical protein